DGERVLAERHQVQAARHAEDSLDVVEERFSTLAVEDLVDLVDADEHAAPAVVTRPPPGGGVFAVFAVPRYQLRQRDRLLGEFSAAAASDPERGHPRHRRAPAGAVGTQVA